MPDAMESSLLRAPCRHGGGQAGSDGRPSRPVTRGRLLPLPNGPSRYAPPIHALTTTTAAAMVGTAVAGSTVTRPLATTGVVAARAGTVAAMAATAVAAVTTSGLPLTVGWLKPGCAPSPSEPMARVRLDHSMPMHGSPL